MEIWDLIIIVTPLWVIAFQLERLVKTFKNK